MSGAAADNVLLVLPAGKEPQAALRAALELARSRTAVLYAVIVVDPSAVCPAASTLTEVGFLGEEVEAQVSEVIVHEQRSRAEALLHALVERAKTDGITVVPSIEAGDAGAICRRLVAAHRIGTAILVAEKQSWLTRWLSRGAALKFPALPGCEVRVMEDE